MQAFHPSGATWTVTKIFPRFSWDSTLLGTLTDIIKEQTIGSGDEASLSIGTLLGDVEGGSFTGDFEGKV
jgi:hypothetical protein